MIKISWWHHRKIIIISCLTALMVGFVMNFVSLRASPRDVERSYWEGQVDERLKQGDLIHEKLDQKLEDIHKDIKSMCNDINDIKLQALKNGIVYGSSSGGTVYLLSLGLQALLARRKNGKI